MYNVYFFHCYSFLYLEICGLLGPKYLKGGSLPYPTLPILSKCFCQKTLHQKWSAQPKESLSNINCIEKVTEALKFINKIMRTVDETKDMEFTAVYKDTIYTLFHDHCSESCEMKNMTGFPGGCFQTPTQQY